jgi:hypothetical protein
MKFNVCNPCCTALPAWTVYHDEVPPDIHSWHVNLNVRAFVETQLPTTGNTFTYFSHLFFSELVDSGDSGTFWIMRNCPAIEGGVDVKMTLRMTELMATGKCIEQEWLKAACIEDFTYIETGSRDVNFKMEFQNGAFVPLSCHLINSTGGNYLNLNGGLGVNDDWHIGETSGDNKVQTSFWYSPVLCAKWGTPPPMVNKQCIVPQYASGWYDGAIGEFSFGDAVSGEYYLVDFDGTGVATAINVQGNYASRWSPYLYGNACGYNSTSIGNPGTSPNCHSYNINWNVSHASIQSYPLYLESACAYGYWSDGQWHFNYYPWQYWWNIWYDWPIDNWSWGYWNYGWWWNYCTRGNSGPYIATQYNWWWGGPYYGLASGGYYWNWWGAQPCNDAYGGIDQLNFCWPWFYGPWGWWGWFGWYWFGSNSPYFGDWVFPPIEDFDAWYESIDSNGMCHGYSRCPPESEWVDADCGVRGTRPLTMNINVTYKGESKTVKMRGDVTFSGAGISTGRDRNGPCTPGLRVHGTLNVTGFVKGTCDFTYTTASGSWTNPYVTDGVLTLFGAGVITNPDGTNTQVLLNGTKTWNPTQPNSFLMTWTWNTTWGTIYDGSANVVVVDFGRSIKRIPMTETGFDFSDCGIETTAVTYKGDVTGGHIFGSWFNCNKTIHCVPRRPILAQANLIHQNIDYAIIVDNFCRITDIVPTANVNCYGLALYEPTTERHALSELTSDSFYRVPNPPMYHYAELPYSECDGDVLLTQLVVLNSDECIEE